MQADPSSRPMEATIQNIGRDRMVPPQRDFTRFIYSGLNLPGRKKKNLHVADATLIGKGNFMSTSVTGLVPIAMIVIGGVLYHVSQKSTPRGVDPFFSLSVSFGIAALACLAIYFIRGGAAGPTKLVNLTAVGLRLSVVALVSGYSIAY